MVQVWVPKPTKIQGMSADLEKTPDVAIALDVELPIVVTKNWKIICTIDCGHQSLMKELRITLG